MTHANADNNSGLSGTQRQGSLGSVQTLARRSQKTKAERPLEGRFRSSLGGWQVDAVVILQRVVARVPALHRGVSVSCHQLSAYSLIVFFVSRVLVLVELAKKLVEVVLT